MAFKKNSQEDFVPQMPTERYWNRHRVTTTFGAASNVDAATSFDTGMRPAAGEPHKWVIAAVLVGPNKESDINIMDGVATSAILRMQLLAGEHLGVLDADDPRVVCMADRQFTYVTSGGTADSWPKALALVSPVPRFQTHLTVACVVSDDAANFRLVELCWEIIYGIAPVSDDELKELLMASALI